MNIKGIKLVTGEEVIADVSGTPDNRIQLKNPVQIRVMPPKMAGSQPSVGFVPFPTFSDQTMNSTVLVEPLHVVYTYEPAEEITFNYNQTFGSGIITPSKRLITE
jgi:hypothetical protein